MLRSPIDFGWSWRWKEGALVDRGATDPDPLLQKGARDSKARTAGLLLKRQHNVKVVIE